MLSLLVAVAVSATLWIAGDCKLEGPYQRFCMLIHMATSIGSSLTRGFPSLEELIRNGSLLERYSTHDGEMRSVPGVRWNCSEPDGGRISKITFIALPGVGMNRPSLRIVRHPGGDQDIDISGGMEKFGEFGYEVTPMNANVMFNDGDMLMIRHPPYEDSGLRLLHQVDDVARNICIGPPGPENCQPDYDYPLLAIETGIQYSVIQKCVAK